MRELLERALSVLKSDGVPGAYIIPLINEIENELEKTDFNDEFNNMVDKGTQAWKDVKNATDFVKEIRGYAGVIQEQLSDDEILNIIVKTKTAETDNKGEWSILPIAFARAIEKAHGITSDR